MSRKTKPRVVVRITDAGGRTLTITSGAAHDMRGVSMTNLVDDLIVSFAEGKDVELQLDFAADTSTVEESHCG